MLRYSTPTIEIEADINLEDFAGLWVSLKQGTIVLRKTKKDLTISGNTLSFELTQEETARFIFTAPVEVQVRWISMDSKTSGSNIVSVHFERVLENEVITIENSN